MADDTKTRVSFNLSQAKRIAAVVKRVEHSYRSTPPSPSRGPLSTTEGVRIAKTQTGGISAIDGSTPGTGNVELYGYEGPGNAIVATGLIVPVSNIAASIPADKLIYVAFGDGGWHVVVYPCTT